MINQIAVFLENKKGRIYDFAKVLADAKVDLVNMSIADTKEFGILRAVTSDNKKALEALKAAGFTVASTDLIGIEVPDRAGALAEVLKYFADAGLIIEYLYSYAKTGEGSALILIKADDVAEAKRIIEVNGIKTV